MGPTYKLLLLWNHPIWERPCLPAPLCSFCLCFAPAKAYGSSSCGYIQLSFLLPGLWVPTLAKWERLLGKDFETTRKVLHEVLSLGNLLVAPSCPRQKPALFIPSKARMANSPRTETMCLACFIQEHLGTLRKDNWEGKWNLQVGLNAGGWRATSIANMLYNFFGTKFPCLCQLCGQNEKRWDSIKG